MSHTPGPWETGTKLGYPVVVIDDSLYAMVSGYSIRELKDSDKSARVAELTRLIGALPELLASLTQFVEHFGDPFNNARAAIAKATGGTQ